MIVVERPVGPSVLKDELNVDVKVINHASPAMGTLNFTFTLF